MVHQDQSKLLTSFSVSKGMLQQISYVTLRILETEIRKRAQICKKNKTAILKFDFKGKFKVTTLKQRPIYMTSGHFHGLKLSENMCIELNINLS